MSKSSPADKKPSIGTHDGAFHADELVACSMLRQLPEYRDAEIIRTRDACQLADCTVVVDVGGIYDHPSRRYDHHQRGFDLTFRDFFSSSKWDIKLSSAGLIYVHYGHRVIASLLNVQQTDPMVDVLFSKLYTWFISEIDAIDNGVQTTENVEPRYKIHTGLSRRVGLMNPQWNKPDMNPMECFMKALAMVQEEFIGYVRHLAEVWYPARALVAEAMNTRFLADSSGALLVLKDHGCPWSSHLFELERLELQSQWGKSELKFNLNDPFSVKSRPIYCLYKRKDGNWSAQTVPLSESEEFSNRLPFPEAWRGLRDEELSKVVNLPGCVFVHASGFLAIHKTYEGIVKLAQKSLESIKPLLG